MDEAMRDYARSDERARLQGYELGNEVADRVADRLAVGAISERQRRVLLAAVVEAVVDHLAYEDEA